MFKLRDRFGRIARPFYRYNSKNWKKKHTEKAGRKAGRKPVREH